MPVSGPPGAAWKARQVHRHAQGHAARARLVVRREALRFDRQRMS